MYTLCDSEHRKPVESGTVELWLEIERIPLGSVLVKLRH